MLLTLSSTAGAEELFPTPRGMDGNVRFWLRVYTEWPTNRYAIHDDQQLDVVYKVIAATDGRSATVKQAKSEVEAALARLDQKRPKSATGLSGVDLEVYNALAGSRDPARYARARGHVRHQKGQADRFAIALRDSGRYRDQMQQILVDHGVPPELLALVFVESMWQLGARSYSGALGPWQFMPYTGREYLNINSVVDERRDPILATQAAAQYLRSAKQRLKVWPVAITSYNYGMNGMARAIQSTGSTDLAAIFDSYRGGRLGFAAKNYYTEFLAALEVMRHPSKYFPDVKPAPRWRYDVVRLPGTATVAELEKAGAATRSQLDALNPALTSGALTSRVRLPAGLALRVPAGKQPQFVAALSKIPGLKQVRDAKPRNYTVRPGDSLIGIARRHGIGTGELLAANQLAREDVIHPGMTLQVPAKSAGYTLLPEARGIAPAKLPAGTAVAAATPPPAPEPEVAPEPTPPPPPAPPSQPAPPLKVARAERTPPARAEAPGLPTVRKARLRGRKIVIVAGPAVPGEDGVGLLETEIAVDVLTGGTPLPAIDLATGVAVPEPPTSAPPPPVEA